MQSIPINLNFKVLRNCSKTWELKFLKSNAPIPITGWTIIFMAKQSLTDADSSAIISHVYTDADFIDAVNGRMIIKITQEDTNIDPCNLYYAVKFITNAPIPDAGVIYTGQMTIENTVVLDQ